jgi:acyl carrier protein
MNGKIPTVRTEAEIRQWMIDKLVTHLQIEPASIHFDEPLIALGIDSMQFVVIVGELEEWLGCRFVNNPLIDYPTINSLARFLADRISNGKMVIDPSEP